MFRSPALIAATSIVLVACASQPDGVRGAVPAAAVDVCRSGVQAIAPGDIASIEPLYTTMNCGKSGTEKRLLGAKLLVRATPATTTESLDRAVECQVTRQIFDGPLEIAVKPAGAGFQIDLVAPSVAEARDLLARATAYAHSSAQN